ncbi:MAG: hypothetical protein AMJ79_09055 [Phycisphaerae bacterium SM23_30]|nr:MAG: hypothetical protein AMJ79_09055 [Phycisphaerae bacterium SM23_30]
MFLARRLILMLVVLTALGGSVAYFTTEMGLTGSGEKARHLGWFVFALMTALSIIMVILIWQSLSQSLRRIRHQLRQFEAEDKIGMIMIDEKDELAELVGAINHYLTRIKTHFQENRIHQKELEIQAWVSEAERHQTEAVIYSISEAVLVTDKFDELLMANQAAQELFRFRLKSSYRHPVSEVIDDKELLELIGQTRQHKSRNVTRLLERHDPQIGKTLSLKVMLSCVLDQKDEIIGVVVVIHDMTAEKEIARLKDDFVSSVSHELKTPLASIAAYVEMLADDEANNEQQWKEFCETIQEQARRLNRLIDNILNISRIESGLMQIARENLDLTGVAHEVIATMRAQAREKDIELVPEFTPEKLMISADRDMIFQALMNLVSNALKYSPPGRKVFIRLGENARRQAVLEVQDYGAGIPHHSLEHIFDKFYRVQENSALSGGTGLGLHLVKQIVQTVHSGEVKVKTNPGRGSTFTILLPLCQTPQSPPVNLSTRA